MLYREDSWILLAHTVLLPFTLYSPSRKPIAVVLGEDITTFLSGAGKSRIGHRLGDVKSMLIIIRSLLVPLGLYLLVMDEVLVQSMSDPVLCVVQDGTADSGRVPDGRARPQVLRGQLHLLPSTFLHPLHHRR